MLNHDNLGTDFIQISSEDLPLAVPDSPELDRACTGCHASKPPTEFHKKRQTKSGNIKRDSRCRECISKIKHRGYTKKSKVKKGCKPRQYAKVSDVESPLSTIQENQVTQSGVDGSRLIRLLSELFWEGIAKDQ